MFLEAILALIAFRELVGSCHRMVGMMVEQSWLQCMILGGIMLDGGEE